MISFIIQIISAGFASFGFALIYNVRGKKLIVPFLGGILTWALYLFLYKIFKQDVICYFLVTSFITFYVEMAARLFKTPSTTFLVSAIIIIIPGGGVYKTMAAIIEQRWQDVVTYGYGTIAIAFAIVVGIMVVSSLTNFYFSIRKIIQKKSAN